MTETISGSDFNEDIQWESIVEQIYNTIATDTAIINKYGMILASKIPSINKGTLLSPTIWDLITKRIKLSEELKVSSIENLVLDIPDGYFVFTFGKYIFLMAKIPKSVELSQFLQSFTRISQALDKSSDKTLTLQFEKLELEEEFNKLTRKDKQGQEPPDNFPIFKYLIKHMVKKK